MDNIIIIEDDVPDKKLIKRNKQKKDITVNDKLIIKEQLNNKLKNNNELEFDSETESDFESEYSEDLDGSNYDNSSDESEYNDDYYDDGFESGNIRKLSRSDINIIKKKIKSLNFDNMIQVANPEYHKTMIQLEEEYEIEPVNILFIIKYKLIEQIDNKYFGHDNIKNIIKYSDFFSEKRLIEILNFVLSNTDIQTINQEFITKLHKKYFLKIKTKKQILCLDFILNYYDPGQEIFDNLIHKKYQMVNFISAKPDKLFKSINTNIQLTQQKNLFNRKNIYNFLDTSDSKIIDFLISNMKKFNYIPIDLLNGVEKILKSKSISIKEEDVIKIIELFRNKSRDISRDVVLFLTPCYLLKHNYTIALDMLDFAINMDKYDYYDYRENINVINDILTESNYLRIKYLSGSTVFSKILKKTIIWDKILSSEKTTDTIIRLGYDIPYDYINKTFSEKYVYQSVILSKHSGRLLNWSLRRKNNEFKKYIGIKKNNKEEQIKNYYKNICKFKIPLNDKLIANFINLIDCNQIIKFYSKTSDVEYIIPYIIYTNRYDLLDKIFEEKILDLNEYKKNFSKYLVKAYGNHSYKYPVNSIYKTYKLNKKYGIKPNISFYRNIIKFANVNVLKKIIKTDNKFSINYKTFAKIFKTNNYTWVSKKYGNMFDYLKPYIKNHNKLYEDVSFVQRLLKTYNNLDLKKIKEIKKLCPNLKIYLSDINTFDFGLGEKNIIEVIEYIFEENFDLDKKKSEQEKIFSFDLKNLINLLKRYIPNDKIIDRTVELYKKYTNNDEIIKQNQIYIDLYNNIYCSHSVVKIYEKFGFYKHNLYSNTIIILLSIPQCNYNDMIIYCLTKYPYIQERTYNYVVCLLQSLKDKKITINQKHSYLYESTNNKIDYLEKVIKLIPKKNIIPNSQIDKYIDKTKERPEGFQLIIDDLREYLYNQFARTDNNDITADL